MQQGGAAMTHARFEVRSTKACIRDQEGRNALSSRRAAFTQAPYCEQLRVTPVVAVSEAETIRALPTPKPWL